MELVEAHITALISLTLGTLIVGMLPTFISSRRRQQCPLVISALLCFGAGVLLSTALIHMLPEVRNKMCPDTSKCKRNVYAEIILCAGFLILYLVDEIVHFLYGAGHHQHQVAHAGMESWSGPTDGTYSTLRLPSASYGSCEDSPLYNGATQAPYNPQFHRPPSENDTHHEGSRPPSQLCHVAHQEPCDANTTTKIGLLVALSVHSLLEGLAVGLESKVNTVLLMLGAIACHKLVVSFCVGLEIAVAPGTTACRHFTSILIFALGSAVGVGAGMIVRNTSVNMSEMAIAALQGLAGGTLLYVTLSEVLPRERASWHQHSQRKAAGVVQFCSFMIGFVTMVVLINFLDYD